MPVTEYLERNARLYPDEVALVELNPDEPDTRRTSWKEFELIQPSRFEPYRREITWSVFDEKANRFANMLIERGIKKGDKVQVLSGKDRGKQGVVLRALPAENKVVVEGVSVVKKAVKPNAANQQGGIVSQEAPIDASNVNLVCPECGKVTRVGHEKDGKKKLRVCKNCGHKF